MITNLFDFDFLPEYVAEYPRVAELIRQLDLPWPTRVGPCDGGPLLEWHHVAGNVHRHALYYLERDQWYLWYPTKGSIPTHPASLWNLFRIIREGAE